MPRPGKESDRRHRTSQLLPLRSEVSWAQKPSPGGRRPVVSVTAPSWLCPCPDPWVAFTLEIAAVWALRCCVAKSLFSCFCKIKDTCFSFTTNFIDLDILSVSAHSRYWLPVGRGQGGCSASSNAWDRPMAKNYLAKMSIVAESSQATFNTFHQSQHFLHTLYKSFFFFFHFGCVFTFLEIINHNMPKMLHIFFYLHY